MRSIELGGIEIKGADFKNEKIVEIAKKENKIAYLEDKKPNGWRKKIKEIKKEIRELEAGKDDKTKQEKPVIKEVEKMESEIAEEGIAKQVEEAESFIKVKNIILENKEAFRDEYPMRDEVFNSLLTSRNAKEFAKEKMIDYFPEFVACKVKELAGELEELIAEQEEPTSTKEPAKEAEETFFAPAELSMTDELLESPDVSLEQINAIVAGLKNAKEALKEELKEKKGNKEVKDKLEKIEGKLEKAKEIREKKRAEEEKAKPEKTVAVKEVGDYGEFIDKFSLSEEDCQKMVNKIKETEEKHGGKVENVEIKTFEKEGKRDLVITVNTEKGPVSRIIHLEEDEFKPFDKEPVGGEVLKGGGVPGFEGEEEALVIQSLKEIKAMSVEDLDREIERVKNYLGSSKFNYDRRHQEAEGKDVVLVEDAVDEEGEKQREQSRKEFADYNNYLRVLENEKTEREKREGIVEKETPKEIPAAEIKSREEIESWEIERLDEEIDKVNKFLEKIKQEAEDRGLFESVSENEEYQRIEEYLKDLNDAKEKLKKEIKEEPAKIEKEKIETPRDLIEAIETIQKSKIEAQKGIAELSKDKEAIETSRKYKIGEKLSDEEKKVAEEVAATENYAFTTSNYNLGGRLAATEYMPPAERARELDNLTRELDFILKKELGILEVYSERRKERMEIEGRGERVGAINNFEGATKKGIGKRVKEFIFGSGKEEKVGESAGVEAPRAEDEEKKKGRIGRFFDKLKPEKRTPESMAIKAKERIASAKNIEELVKVAEDIMAEKSMLKKETRELFNYFKERFLNKEHHNLEREKMLENWIRSMGDTENASDNFKGWVEGVSEEWRGVAKELLNRIESFDADANLVNNSQEIGNIIEEIDKRVSENKLEEKIGSVEGSDDLELAFNSLRETLKKATENKKIPEEMKNVLNIVNPESKKEGLNWYVYALETESGDDEREKNNNKFKEYFARDKEKIENLKPGALKDFMEKLFDKIDGLRKEKFERVDVMGDNIENGNENEMNPKITNAEKKVVEFVNSITTDVEQIKAVYDELKKIRKNNNESFGDFVKKIGNSHIKDYLEKDDRISKIKNMKVSEVFNGIEKYIKGKEK